MMRVIAPMMMLALAGCGASRAGPVDPIPESSPSASPTYADPNEQQYIDDANASGLLPRYGSDDGALRLGHQICRALAKNLSTGYLAQEISKDGIMPYTVVEQFAYDAKNNLCPQFRGD